MNRTDPPHVLCPSARMKDGALLIGIVLEGGRVAFTANKVAINREFVESAQQGRSPEKRFRFSDACVKGGCRQWTGERCGVIDQILTAVPSDEYQANLPECSIRPQCRWYHQSGADACRVCPMIVTDAKEDPVAA